jgi:peptide subunit release factor 1 (eRF1)
MNKELKTASNIKNKNVGKAVTEALRSVSYRLKILSDMPNNGLVICAGQYSFPNTIENRPDAMQHL